MKKLVTLLLAMVMIFSLATTAFAAGTGSITIENTTIDQTYAVYKVFDATYSGDAVAYTYTKTGETDALYAALTVEGSPFNLTQTDNGNTYYVTSTADATTISSWLTTNKDKLTVTSTIKATTGSTTFENLEYGYYYITSSLGAVVTIDTVAPNATVIDKNDEVDVPEKEADDDSVELGQTVTFTVTEVIDHYVGTDTVYSYTFTDSMSAGLTFNKDVKIEVDGQTVTLDVAYTDNGFSVTVPTYDKENNVFLYDDGDVIKLTYTATVNANAVTKVENNKVEVDWTNQDGKDKDAGSDEVKLYSAKIVIDKVDEDKNKLKGAEFVLYKETENGKSYYKLDQDKVTWVAEIKDATKVTTDENGAAAFEGLENGTYYLLETKAPEGYNLLNEPAEIVIAGDEADTAKLTQTQQVINKAGTELPSTGGVGTTMFYVIGGLMMLMAVVLLVTKKRMASAE